MLIEKKSFVNNLVQITHENRGYCLVVELTFKSVKDQESYYSMETKARDSLKSLHLNTNLFNIEQHNGCKITYTCEENISFLSESPNPIGYNYVLNLITELVNMSEILSANGFICLGFHPQNIALNHEGNRIFFVSAVDFIFQAGKTSYYFGNFHFAPPESTGRTDLLIDSRSTIYQLGALTYFSLTLKNQYEQSDFEKLIYAILSSTPKLDLSQLAKARHFEKVFNKAIAKDSTDRYQSFYGFLKDLSACLNYLSDNLDTYLFYEADIVATFNNRPTLVGRKPLLERISSEILDGSGVKARFLVGSSGVGKTMFIDHLIEKLRKKISVFRFTCESNDLVFSPLRHILSAWTAKEFMNSDDSRDIIKNFFEGMTDSYSDLILEYFSEHLPTYFALKAHNGDELDKSAKRQLFFLELIRKIASIEERIVFIIEDTEKMDFYSISFFENFLDSFPSNVSLLLCSRGGDTLQNTLTNSVAACKGDNFVKFELGPLNDTHIEEILNHHMSAIESESKQKMVSYLSTRTKGVPLYLAMSIKFWHKNGNLFFDTLEGCWKFKNEETATKETENDLKAIISLNHQNLKSSAKSVIEVLTVMNAGLSADTICTLCEFNLSKFEETIAELMQLGFVTYKANRAKISQSVIREISSEKIPVERRECIERKILSVLLNSGPELPGNSELSRLSELIINQPPKQEDDESCRRYLKVLLEVKELATRSGNSLSAAEILASVLSSPYNHYIKKEEKFSLRLERCQLEFRNSRLTETFVQLSDLIAECDNRVSKGKAIVLFVEVCSALQKREEAIEVATSYLFEDGIVLPKEDFASESLKNAASLLIARPASEVAELAKKECIKKEQIAINMEILCGLSAIYYNRGEQNCFFLSNLIIANSAFDDGISTSSAYGLSVFGMYLVKKSLFKEAKIYGVTVKKVIEQSGSNLRGRAKTVYGLFFHPFFGSIQECYEILDHAYEDCMNAGDITYGNHSLLNSLIYYITHFPNARELPNYIQRINDFVALTGQTQVCMGAFSSIGMYYNLMTAKEGDLSLNSNEYSEEVLFAQCQDAKYKTGLANFYLRKLQLMVLNELFDQGNNYIQSYGEIIEKGTSGKFYLYEYMFLKGMCLINGSNNQTKSEENTKTISEIKEKLNDLSINTYKNNFILWLDFLLIEMESNAYIQSKNLAILIESYISIYDKLVEESFSLYASFCLQRLSNKLIDAGFRKLALGFEIDNAEFLSNLGLINLAKRRNHSSKLLEVSTILRQHFSTENPNDNFDLKRIQEVAEFFAGAQNLNSILKFTLLNLAESCGATMGELYLLDEKAGSLLLRGRLESGQIVVNQKIPLGLAKDFSSKIVNYCWRKKTSLDSCSSNIALVLGQLQIQELEAAKSFLCVAINKQNKTIGIMYLENNQSRAVFTESRVKFAETLTSLASSSIDNSELYETMEKRILESTAEITRKSLEVTSIMDSIPQGIFCIVSGGIIDEGHSEHLLKIFSTNHAEGRKFSNFLFENSSVTPDTTNWTEAVIDASIGSPILAWEFNNEKLVREYSKKLDGLEKWLRLIWSPILENDEVTKIMVVVTDITEEKTLLKRALAQQKELNTIGCLLRIGQSRASSILQDTLTRFDTIFGILNQPSQGLNAAKSIFREYHTIKGISRTVNFEEIKESVHLAENLFSQVLAQKAEEWPKEKALEQFRVAQESALYYNEVLNLKLGYKPETSKSDQVVEQIRRKLVEPISNELKIYSICNILGSDQTDLGTIISRIIDGLDLKKLEILKSPPKFSVAGQLSFFREDEMFIEAIFTHLITNSISHGFKSESAKSRISSDGFIRIFIQLVEYPDNSKYIEYSDNGNGLNLRKLASKLPETASLDEIAMSIFDAGTTTSDTINDLSGRGVGLNAVQSMIHGNQSQIEIILLSDKPDSEGYIPFMFRISLKSFKSLKSAA